MFVSLLVSLSVCFPVCERLGNIPRTMQLIKLWLNLVENCMAVNVIKLFL